LLKYEEHAQLMRTFRFSIYHLMLLFGLLILDHHWLWRLS
jgi:protoheme IX farnesyltransferase